MHRTALLFAVAIVAAVTPAEMRSQNVEGARAAVTSPAPLPSALDSAAGAPTFAIRSAPQSSRRFAAIASFIVPGSGQFILGNDRFLGYLAVEALAWWKYSKDIAERADREREYKDISRRVARANFPPTSPAGFRDAGWSYYEWMRDEKESGPFSLSVSGPVVPDTSSTTYNGKRWALARETQPTYEAALLQYEDEAIRPEFRWSWFDKNLQWDLYKRMTDKRNDAARAAVQDLLVIGANHFLSMIDAFSTLRLQSRTDPDGRTRVGAMFHW